MSLTLYGIPNCDKVRAARRWLKEHRLDAEFIDLRNPGIDAAILRFWCDQLGWETLLNKRSTSWRALNDDQKQDLSAESACALMLENPTLIKRPVLNKAGTILLDFTTTDYQALLL